MTGAHVDDRTAVLEARNVSLDFDGTDSSGSKVTIHALDRVNLTIHRGEITALVGESGSGKTSIARLFALIYKPTSGELYRNGELVHVHGKRAERAYYRDVQLIYQDPFASLNGLKKISTILGRVFKIHYPKMRRKEIAQRIDDVLTKVNMTPPSRYLNRYPTDLSGGQRQRIAIARALAVSPQVLLADEPTSMLDASIRLDVLNLLSDLRETEGVSVLYITHDIASARYICDRINVMYGGRIVEAGPTKQIISDTIHPYTRLLLSAAPDPARYKGSANSTVIDILEGAPMNNSVRVKGCRFAPLCPLAQPRCTEEELPKFHSEDGTREVTCWEAEERREFHRV